MRDSPLRAAVRRARHGLGQEQAVDTAPSTTQGAIEQLATRSDRPPMARLRPVVAWSPAAAPPPAPTPAKGGLEDELARRLARRVEGHTSTFDPASATPPAEPSARLGEGELGEPLWQSMLGAHASRAPPATHLPEAWAWGLRWSEQQTFRHWVVLESNRGASSWADHVVSNAGEVNPLVIQGPPGSGRSHLLHAIGQALLRRQEGGVALLRHPASMPLDVLDAQFSDLDARLSRSSGVLIDDVDEAIGDPERCRRLHHVVDLAMNLGVQVVVCTTQPPATWPSSPLSRVMQEGVMATLASPGPIDRLAALRAMAVRDALVVENDVLQSIAAEHPTWRGLENGLRSHLHAPAETSSAEASPVTDHVETATAVIQRALDAVDAGGAIGGVELTVPVPEISDDWTPEVPDAVALLEGAPRPEGVAQAVLEVARDPRVDQLLRPNERDQYLVRDVERLEMPDAVRAAEVMADIDLDAEAAIVRRRHAAEDQNLRLEALKLRMEALASEAREADVEELLAITDELQSIDQELDQLAKGSSGPARLARLRPVRIPEGQA